MSKVSNKLGKSEVNLIKHYCSRVSDEDLAVLAGVLPQTIAFDRALACDIFQKDKEVDRWLAQAAGPDELFSKIDGIGEFAAAEIENRSKKK